MDRCRSDNPVLTVPQGEARNAALLAGDRTTESRSAACWLQDGTQPPPEPLALQFAEHRGSAPEPGGPTSGRTADQTQGSTL
jgi:hypothetical protein